MSSIKTSMISYQVKYLFRLLVAIIRRKSISSGSDYPFLFIVGSGRSGNTLLRRLLMERADIYIPPESYVMPEQVKSSFAVQGLSWQNRVDFFVSQLDYSQGFGSFDLDSLRDFARHAKEWSAKERYLDTLCFELYKYIGSEQGYCSSWFGDKTPINTLHLPTLQLAYPKAKYLFIKRDGGDVIASYLASGLIKDVSLAAQRWLDSVSTWQHFKRGLNDARRFEVSYEALVTDTDKVLNAIIDHFGIPKREADELLAVKLGDVSDYSHHANVLDPVSGSSVGKGRGGLSSSQKKVAGTIINDCLVRLGYDEL